MAVSKCVRRVGRFV